MIEWKQVKLSELGEIVGGATPSTSHEEYYNGDIPWLTPKDLAGYTSRYIKSGERNITKAGLDSCSAKIMPKNTVLFSSRAPIGYIAIAENDICTNQGFKSIIPNESTVPLFLYYLLKFNKNRIESMGSGTTFKEVSGRTMGEVVVKIPVEKKIQEKIASILDSLDSKIELINKINDNLEQQLRMVFAELFAEKITNVEAYDNLPLGQLVTSIDNRGKTPPLETTPTEYPVIDVRALSGHSRIVDYTNCTKYVSAETYSSWFRSGHPKPKDILISTVGSLAEMKFFLGFKGCIAQNVVGFRAKNISAYYLYQYLSAIKSDLVAYNIGSVQPSIKVTHIIKHPIYVPAKEELETFDGLAEKATNTIYNNALESECLSNLRNTLLPKLMSGELDISNVTL